MLTERQIERYSRQIILQAVGGRGQEALLGATVAVVGDHPAVETVLVYLSAAGVGRLIHAASTPAPGELINPDVQVERTPIPTDPVAVATVASACTAVVGVASPEEIRPVHEACAAAEQPLLWGYSVGRRAWVARLGHGTAHCCPACLAVSMDAPPTGPTDAVLAPVTAAWTGTLLATETLKLVLRISDALSGDCVAYDAVTGTVTSLRLTRTCACANRVADLVSTQSGGR